MKYITFLLAFVVFFGCTDKQKIAQLEQQNSKLKKEFSLLTEQSSLKDQFIEEYTKTINDVYDNLERIRKKEGMVTKFTQDSEKKQIASYREKMLNNVSSIESYLKESKVKLNRLQEKLHTALLNNATFEETITKLNQTIEAKEQEIGELRQKVEQLNTRVAEVEGKLQQREELIANQTSTINSAFYIIGNEKDLKGKGIIEEKGGILGIRKTKKLAPGFNTDEFTKLNMVTDEVIPIDRSIKNVKIISPHDPESYHLVKKDENQTLLEIINPDAFWKIKYLVIMTKG